MRPKEVTTWGQLAIVETSLFHLAPLAFIASFVVGIALMGLRLPMGRTCCKLVFLRNLCFEYDRIQSRMQALEASRLTSVNYFSAANHRCYDAIQ